MSNITPIGVFSFPHLFKPRAATEGADPRYSVNVLWDAAAQNTPEFQKLRQAILAAAKDKWGDKAEAMFKNGQLRSPLRDCSEKEYAGYDTPGGKYANFWSVQPVGIIDGRLEDVIDASYVYPGCMGRVAYRAFAYDRNGNKGVGLGLENVQVTDVTTDRLDGRQKAQNQFTPTETGSSGGSAASASLDDELPF